MLVVDTGPRVAASDRDDPDHAACVAVLDRSSGPLVTTALVVAEAGFLIARQVGSAGEVALVADVAEGRIRIGDLTPDDWKRTHTLVERYADLSLGVTDASLIAFAERQGVDQIATLDHRHFRVVRPLHRVAFRLVP